MQEGKRGTSGVLNHEYLEASKAIFKLLRQRRPVLRSVWKMKRVKHKSPKVRLLVSSSFGTEARTSCRVCVSFRPSAGSNSPISWFLIYNSSEVFDGFQTVLDRVVKARGEWTWDSNGDSAELFNMQLRFQGAAEVSLSDSWRNST